MTKPAVPVVNYIELLSPDLAQRDRAIATLGHALEEIGFFMVANSPISPEVRRRAHQTASHFFSLPETAKRQYEPLDLNRQGGFSRFGSEQAKGHTVPDLKEFWHVNHHSLTQDDAPWPQEVPAFRPVMTRLYQQLAACAQVLLEACALYLGQPASWLMDMTQGGNTVLRLAYYPPLPAARLPGSLRAAPHEDINLITLLCEATTPGLEILTHKGQWLPIIATPDQLVVDTGDMLQNLTNGLFKSTTHRVANPSQGNQCRLAMPFFVHPRPEVDLSPQATFFERTGGLARFPNLTAAEYLAQRLAEIQAKPA